MKSPPPLVLHVIHHLQMGGLENGLVNIVNTMPADRYRHAIACIEDVSDFRNRIRRADVEVVALHREQVGLWRLRRALVQLCRRLKPAIVHSRNFSGLDAIVPAAFAGVPFRVHGEHGWDVGDLRGERRKPALLRRLHAPFVTRYVTVSRDLARYLEQRVGISPSKITHICNGADTERFRPPDLRPSRARLPESFQDPGLVIVGTVGRAQAVKDQVLLVRAFAAARDASPVVREKARLAVVGDGPLLGELRSTAAALGLESVVWLPGALQEVPDVLRAFDVFVLPSKNEGISNTILEALASGLPVVATNVGGNPELVDDGVTGRLVPSEEVASLARAIGDYVENAELRRRHGEAARQAALTRFSLPTMVGRYQALYDHLALGGPLP